MNLICKSMNLQRKDFIGRSITKMSDHDKNAEFFNVNLKDSDLRHSVKLVFLQTLWNEEP